MSFCLSRNLGGQRGAAGVVGQAAERCLQAGPGALLLQVGSSEDQCELWPAQEILFSDLLMRRFQNPLLLWLIRHYREGFSIKWNSNVFEDSASGQWWLEVPACLWCRRQRLASPQKLYFLYFRNLSCAVKPECRKTVSWEGWQCCAASNSLGEASTALERSDMQWLLFNNPSLHECYVWLNIKLW